MSTLAEIEAAADALPVEQKHELLLFLASRLRGQQTDIALDREYERGYTRLPEDLSLTNALLPYLAVDTENWE